VTETLFVTYGINHSGSEDCSSTAGGITAYGHSGFAIAKLIFERERVKDFTRTGDVNSGRFKCFTSTQQGDGGDTARYWVCDNGDRFSRWSSSIAW
jgi:hypothetical protein